MLKTLRYKNRPISFKAIHSSEEIEYEDLEENFLTEPSLLTIGAFEEMIDFMTTLREDFDFGS